MRDRNFYIILSSFTFKLFFSSCNLHFHESIFRSRPLRVPLFSHPTNLIFYPAFMALSPSLYFFSVCSISSADTNEIIPVAFPIGWDLHPIVPTALRAPFFRSPSWMRSWQIRVSYWHNTEGASSTTLVTLGRLAFFLPHFCLASFVSDRFSRERVTHEITSARLLEMD